MVCTARVGTAFDRFSISVKLLKGLSNSGRQLLARAGGLPLLKPAHVLFTKAMGPGISCLNDVARTRTARHDQLGAAVVCYGPTPLQHGLSLRDRALKNWARCAAAISILRKTRLKLARGYFSSSRTLLARFCTTPVYGVERDSPRQAATVSSM
jgi:hypothetical protein